MVRMKSFFNTTSYFSLRPRSTPCEGKQSKGADDNLSVNNVATKSNVTNNVTDPHENVITDTIIMKQ